MKEEIKDRWVQALMSGKYKQGRDRLRTENKFCCLGVLCDLAAKDGFGYWEDNRFYYDQWDARAGDLPQGVRKWAGIVTSDGQLPFAAEGCQVAHETLSNLNDEGNDFETIACVIEGFWEDL